MRGLGKWSVEHRVSVNLIMIFVIISGLFVVLNMKREMFPQFSLDMIHVSVPYPGASPEEVEEGICIKIEEQLKSLEDVKTVRSTAEEGMGGVLLELEPGTDISEKLDEVRTEVDLIDSFPEEAEDPVIQEINSDEPAIYVAVYGQVDEALLKETAEQIRDDLVEGKHISLAEVTGVREYELSIEVSEEALRRFQLTFDQVAAAVKSGSLELPGGKIRTRGGEFLVRAKGKKYFGREYGNIPLITRPDGTMVRLGDVAKILDGFEETDVRARFNGQPAAMVVVKRTDSQDTIKISRAVIEYLEDQAHRMPRGIQLGHWVNMAEMVQDRIDLLLKNGIQGIILVFIVLALFLDLGLAFWVASGIPISFMAAFLLLEYLGASINMLSMFGFIMTLGILVDDAIIVGENVFTHYAQGKSPRQAVLDSMGQIGWPVVMAVATTIVAFTPLMHIAGIMGKFIYVMPQAVICILAVSLFEAFVILPAHLEGTLSMRDAQGAKNASLVLRLRARLFRRHEALRVRVEAMLDHVIQRRYLPVLKLCLHHRYLTLALALGAFIMSMGLLAGGHVPFVFFTRNDSNWIIAELVYPQGTPRSVTEETISRIDQGAFALNEHFRERTVDGADLVVNTHALVGVIPRRDWKPGVYGGHCGNAWIEVLPAGKRPDIPAHEIVAKWREFTGNVPGTELLTFAVLSSGPGGNPIEIQLAGPDLGQLRAAARALKTEIAAYPGTFDISDDFRPGKLEKQIFIREGAQALGVTLADIARQIRQAYYGEEVLKIQRGKHDIKVMVRYDKAERETQSSLENLRIRTADGRQIPLNQVARVETRQGYSTIRRVDRKRVITVVSDLDEDKANARKITARLAAEFLPGLVRHFPGVSYDLEGQAKRTQESIDSLIKGFSLAAMVIFLLLASQFRSYAQPVIIMAAIPFGLVGAVGGHLIMGLDITIISIFGIVALSGIVVNDSLILIDFANNRIRQGDAPLAAVLFSGRSRFRPVLLTSVTTVAGLLPLLTETSFQAQFLIPMAVSISFGLMAATVLTLIVVPALYLVVHDVTGPRERSQDAES